ncbi:MAG: shikimate kinase [Maricaulaceae bacterium]
MAKDGSALNAPHFRIDKTIALVGLMGAGKTTVGRRLALALSIDFVDADEAIETAAGCSISDMFSAFGEAYFRAGERRVIERLLDGPPKVLATGGGAFIQDETRALLRAQALTVWLKADLEILVRRVRRRDTRPLLRGQDVDAVMSRLMAERYPIYAQADICVESVDGPHHKTVDLVLEALRADAAGSPS